MSEREGKNAPGKQYGDCLRQAYNRFSSCLHTVCPITPHNRVTNLIIVPLFLHSSSYWPPPLHLLTMNYRESLYDLVDRIRRNDESAKVVQLDSRLDSVENLSILDALKKNTMVKHLFVNQLSQEGLLKLSAVMKCNNSVQFLYISIERGLNREGLFATMATSGSWSSLHTLHLACDCNL